MDWDGIWMAVGGGIVIGVASVGLLALIGKGAGISGILNGVVSIEKPELSWKAAFLLGLIVSGFAMTYVLPERFEPSPVLGLPWLVLAGLLVGFGTRLGGGCTSGHGICGIGRLSIRSIVGTVVFIGLGIVVVTALRISGVTS